MPEIQHASTRQIRYNQPARVLNLQQWKKKMGKESDDKPHKPTDQLSDREALLRIVDLASTPGLSDEALLEMVKALVAQSRMIRMGHEPTILGSVLIDSCWLQIALNMPFLANPARRRTRKPAS
jgi:hypothetical protein